MTGHNDGAEILRQCFRDVTGQSAVSQTLCDFAIGERCAGRDAACDLVNASMKLRRRADIDRQMIQVSALAADQRGNIVDRFTSGGGAPSRAMGKRRSRRLRVAALLRSGSCTPAMPRSLHTMPQHPIAVSKRAKFIVPYS